MSKVIISLYYSTNYLLVLAILVLPYMPDGFKVVITAGAVAVGTTFSSILLTRCFSNCRNYSNDCVTRYSR